VRFTVTLLSHDPESCTTTFAPGRPNHVSQRPPYCST
jgi:hypothetical protein